MIRANASLLLKATIRYSVFFIGLFTFNLAGAQTLYNFTAAGAVGNTGPDQAMIDSAYSGTNLQGNVTVDSGIQTWTVPRDGVYGIDARGGQGFGQFGGRGARVYTEMYLTAGTSLKILVGQRGGEYLDFPGTTYNHQFGGGGGSFVTLTDNTPLVVAGGGGGSHFISFQANADGQVSEAGAAGTGAVAGTGGTNGNGGNQATAADGGGGLLTNGAGTAGGQAFIDGGLGGIDEGQGGFGGGGGTSSWNNYRGGGGGGYSGGGGGNNGATCCAAGGGGGSFVADNSWNTELYTGSQLGDGSITISFSNDPCVQSFCFTTAGATGNTGPNQTMVDDAYSGTNLEGDVLVFNGRQEWTAPTDGVYGIETRGGQGFGDFGGRGAIAYTELYLDAGDTLLIIVGQRGGEYLNFPATTYNHQFGGGGGSFVTNFVGTPIVVAGGGGGNHFAEFLDSADGQITEAGAAGTGAITGTGGINGNGGNQANSADGGGGLLTNGAGIAGGQAFVNGSLGGIDEGQGGFGGGGGTSSWNNYRGGGGGGYSGGGGGNNGGACCAAGGGGGSYTVGVNTVIFAGANLGDGLVKITPGGNKPPADPKPCSFYVIPGGAVICL